MGSQGETSEEEAAVVKVRNNQGLKTEPIFILSQPFLQQLCKVLTNPSFVEMGCDYSQVTIT